MSEKELKTYTEFEHIAHDMRMGRFPERSNREQYLSEVKDGMPVPDFWCRIKDDSHLENARRKLSFDEFRRIANHVLEWERARSALSKKEG